MNLIDILQKHGAEFAVTLKDRPEDKYNTYHALIQFEANTIKVSVYNDEGGAYDFSEDDPMPFEWVEQIHALVTDLKEAKAIPNYTLELPTT